MLDILLNLWDISFNVVVNFFTRSVYFFGVKFALICKMADLQQE